jgi:ankyrin repeat protein
VAVVRLLLENSATIDSKSNYAWTPLLYAAGMGHEAVVKLLLNKGAAVDSKDNTSETLL